MHILQKVGLMKYNSVIIIFVYSDFIRNTKNSAPPN